MSRAALLIAAANPYLDDFWCRNYATWRDQVDELWVVVTAQFDPAVQDMIRQSVEAVGGRVAEFANAEHGVAISKVLPATKADYVLLMEEDAYFRDPKAVGAQFARIESGEVDVVGCPRSTGTPEVIAFGNDRYGQMVAAESGEAGPLLWPCLLWAKREDLVKVGHYSVWGCRPGGELFGHQFTAEQAMDTFGYASLAMQEMGLRIGVVPNYRSDMDKMPGWNPPWFHVGGLSTGYGMYVMGPREHDVTHLRGTDLRDWSKRIAFWQLAGGSPEYMAALDDFIVATEMDRAEVAQWRGLFEPWITW